MPLPERDASRLLVLDRHSGSLAHTAFSSLPGELHADDLLIVNRSRVLPARLLGKTAGGGQAEVLYLFPEPTIPDHFRAMVRPGRRLRVGAVVHLDPDTACRVVAVHPDGARTIRLEGTPDAIATLQRLGHLPLPPYIDRAPTPLDRERYQTIYAKEGGSIAAPTAGLHFTHSLLDRIRAKGVHVAEVVLHVGPGTFARVDVDDVADHKVPPEAIFVPEETARAFALARERNARVIAVGTTTARTLETMADGKGLRSGRAETSLVIHPGHEFRAVDALITNFHLPMSSLLFLVSAFAGRDRILAAYAAAVKENYRFYSYGDAMFIR